MALSEKMPQETWHVEDAEVRGCIPESGFLRDYMDYCETTCDGALWFQLAGILTVLSVISGKANYHAAASNGRYRVEGLQLWSALVGISGSRKSESTRPAVRILQNVNGRARLATDGSLEAYHDCLKERDGIGLFLRDELTTLFTQAKRSYTTGLPGWLLEAYGGGPIERTTKAGGSIEIPVVRLSILGNIPPSTLQVNTSREDWRSGFLPRFLFWGARRVRDMEIATWDPGIENRLALRLQKYVQGRALQVIIPYEVGRILTEWYRAEVDSKGHLMADELYSTLIRLQSKGYQIASLYALGRLNHEVADGQGIRVEEEDMRHTLHLLKLMKRSTTALFSSVGGSDEATQEKRVFTYISQHPGATTMDIADSLGISVKAAYAICLTLTQQSIIVGEASRGGGKGRKAVRYYVALESRD